MPKPDLFDEIIFCLRETGMFNPTASLSREIVQDLFGKRTLKAEKQVRIPPEPPLPVPAGVPLEGTAEPHPDYSSTDWEELEKQAESCRRCPLHSGRSKVVFGAGSREADLMFIGEGPGADEDRLGMPFVGRAGELLTRMINAMQFNREDVYIANIVKCRPPGNRNPEEQEANTCMPFLSRQIELVQPKVIVLLGAVPARYLLDVPSISKIRGHWLDYNGIKVMPTFHPAYLLRNPPAKAQVWQDLQIVMKFFGKTPVSTKKRA